MGTTNARNIDGDKLRAELKRRGLTQVDASVGIGFSRTLLSSAINGGRLSEPAVILLEKIYNISPETYCIPNTPPSRGKYARA